MKTDISKIPKYELIGLKARITSSKNKSNIGIEGKIINETKNTINIGGKIVLKKNIEIELMINNKKTKIDGGELLKNPVERIKSR